MGLFTYSSGANSAGHRYILPLINEDPWNKRTIDIEGDFPEIHKVNIS